MPSPPRGSDEPGQVGFVGRTKVAPPFEPGREFALLMALVEQLDCIVVLEPGKRRRDGLQFREVTSKFFELGPALFKYSLNDVAEEVLGECHYVIQVCVCDFGLNHPKLSQVATGLGLLGAESRTEAINLAEGGGSSFVIELAGLREVGLAILKVIDAKKGGGSFASSRREYRGVHQDKSIVVKVIPDSADDFGSHRQDSVLAARPEPQVAIVHLEFDAVLFGSNWIWLGDLEDLNASNIELVTAWRA